MTPATPSWWYLALLLVLACGCAAYANSLSGPFVYDDKIAISENSSIRRLWSADVFRPERELPVAGRPLVNASFAVNYALHGLDVRGYHVVNLFCHLWNALLIAGIVRRTCGRDGGGQAEAMMLGAFSAAVWVVHPLGSEAVSYVTQRSELMFGSALLLTLYASLRAASSTSPGWSAVAIAACAMGMACKESMVVAPVIVGAYDRVFLFRSWREAVAKRWPLYAGLASTWIILAALLSTGARIHSAGFSAGVSPWTYLLNQAQLIPRYLRLVVWPDGLVLNYGEPVAVGVQAVWLQMLAIGALLAASLAALWRGRRLGFLGWWFFAILAPASSLVPIVTEVGAERRMYLPLAAAVVVFCAHCVRGLRRFGSPGGDAAAGLWASPIRLWPLGAMAVVVVALTVTTRARNEEYGSALRLATTSLERWPTPVARHMVATELAALGRHDEALAEMRQSVKGYPRGFYDLGVELFGRQAYAESIEAFQSFIDAEPLLLEVPDAHALIGRGWMARGEPAKAVEHLDAATRMRPARLEWRGLLGDALFHAGRYDQASAQYDAYLGGYPRDTAALANLGIARAAQGSLDLAIEAFRRAAEIEPSNQAAHRNLANALLDKRAFPEALGHAREAARLGPSDAVAFDILGLALAASGQVAEAAAAFDRGVALAPADPEIRAHAAAVRGGTGRAPERARDTP